MTWWPRDGSHFGALTPLSSKPPLLVALLPSRCLTLGCSRAGVPRGSPVFPGASLFGVLPGSTVPLDRARPNLAGSLLGLHVFDRLLDGGRAILLWGI